VVRVRPPPATSSTTIDIPETLGLDHRVEFYESTGAYKDMVFASAIRDREMICTG
jgi:hypothetical protein